MNNKGQTLVLFLVLFPIFVIVFISFYQVGSMALEKNKIRDSIKESLEYGVNNIDDILVNEKIVEMITKENPNIKEENITIDKKDNEITITVIKKYLISFIVEDELKISYTGKMILSEIEIIENRG